MNAIRVAKRGKGNAGVHTWHWLLDEGRTMCGRNPDDLQVVDHADLETLPAREACGVCVRFAADWTPHPRARAPLKITAPPAPGTLRTSGSLQHGTLRRHGRRL